MRNYHTQYIMLYMYIDYEVINFLKVNYCNKIILHAIITICTIH